MAGRSAVTLLDIRDEDLSVTLVAEITDDGDLLLSGHDLGRRVEGLLGADEYEYWLTVPADGLGSLAEALSEAVPHVGPVLAEGGLLRALQVLFGDGTFRSDSAFRSWLTERGIPSRFASWH